MKHRITATVAAALLACLGLQAHAQERGEHRAMEHEHARVAAAHERFELDQRYHHDHYYPPRGYAVAALPSGSMSIGFRGDHFFFHGGVWFRPVGPRFVVTLPPVGIISPVLPPDVVTLWIGGAPYYYANGAYYAAAPGQGYVVVAPPPGAEAAQPVPAPKPAPDPILYPRNGQSPEQTEADRQSCNRWATTQPSAMADAHVFQRAVAACMDGRGYTVR